MQPSSSRLLRAERPSLLLILLGGLGLRLWALGAKGLAYDEAATALMARASAAEIVTFHWNAAFEHPPLWQLSMHTWSGVFGQSEAALRLLPALAGVLAVPLVWYWVRLLWPEEVRRRLLAAGLVALSPSLVLYSQEARMYTIVVLLALLSLCLVVDLVQRPGWRSLLLFVVVNWLLTGFHYYALLLIGAEGLFLLALAARRRSGRAVGWWLGALAASVAPIALWLLLAPGFHDTFAVIAGGIGKGGAPPALAFADGLWRDLSFGAFRWQPPTAVAGYLLAPLVIVGLAALMAADWRPRNAVPWSWLVALAALLPLAVSVVLFRSLAARYVLFVLPALYVLAAAGISWLWARSRLLGGAGLVLAIAVAVLGLGYYFGGYNKSDYREMAAFLRSNLGPDDAVMLYAPRQHLLARYYLGEDRVFATAPQVDLPRYWPVTAPKVVPEELDGQIQDLLAAHPVVWLVTTAQDEVDPGEFVPKYFTAVSYKQDCWPWRDVTLCRFLSPAFVVSEPAAQVHTLDALFGDDLRLTRTSARLIPGPTAGQHTVLAELDWVAERKPAIDYRVTLRLLDAQGEPIAQRDDFPIGVLLPPTTWNAGDAKPGYFALPLPADLPSGAYRVTVGVYNPDDATAVGEPIEVAAFDLP